MNPSEAEQFDTSVYAYVLRVGSVRPSDISRYKKCKHETATRSLNRLVDSGKLYKEKYGKSTYYTVRPDSLSETSLDRVRPDSRKFPLAEGITTDGCGRGSVDVESEPVEEDPHIRARNISERIEVEGFVLWPTVKGCDVSREWVRIHHNGQYHVRVTRVGRFETFNADTCDTAEWKTSMMNTQRVYNGKIGVRCSNDPKRYSVRMVCNKAGKIGSMAVYIHPRYAWYKGHERTQVVEFRRQTEDVLKVLEAFGWRFDYDSIATTGEFHTALNDPALASRVGKYNDKNTDEIHYDASPGYPEAEVYGNANPDDVEIMVMLPTIIRSLSESVHALYKTVNEVVAIQARTLQVIVPQNPVSAARPMDNNFGMYM